MTSVPVCAWRQRSGARSTVTWRVSRTCRPCRRRWWRPPGHRSTRPASPARRTCSVPACCWAWRWSGWRWPCRRRPMTRWRRWRRRCSTRRCSLDRDWPAHTAVTCCTSSATTSTTSWMMFDVCSCELTLAPVWTWLYTVCMSLLRRRRQFATWTCVCAAPTRRSECAAVRRPPLSGRGCGTAPGNAPSTRRGRSNVRWCRPADWRPTRGRGLKPSSWWRLAALMATPASTYETSSNTGDSSTVLEILGSFLPRDHIPPSPASTAHHHSSTEVKRSTEALMGYSSSNVTVQVDRLTSQLNRYLSLKY